MIRLATIDDIGTMKSIRDTVRENAERLYRRRGWQCDGTTTSGELRFSLTVRTRTGS